jgi:hypothetical protein
MSIANLENGQIPEIIADTGTFRQLYARDIDTNDNIATTLFIGADVVHTRDIQLGALTGFPTTCISGLFCKSIEAGGSLGVGPIIIGSQPQSTAILLGAVGSNTNVLGNFTLPSTTLTPLLIFNSFQQQTINTASTGAIVNAAAANVTYYKINNIVTVFVKSLLLNVAASATAVPLVLTTPLPVGVQPANNLQFGISVTDNGTIVGGICKITTGGGISIGNYLNFTLNNPGTVGFNDFSMSYFSP